MVHPIHRVTRFELVGPYTLAVVFEDCTEQVIDFEPILHGELFGPLRDQATFKRGHPGCRIGDVGVAQWRRLRSGHPS